MRYCLSLLCLISPLSAVAEWRSTAPGATALLSESQQLGNAALVLGLLLFSLLFAIGIVAPLILLFVSSSYWAWVAASAYALLSAMNIFLRAKASKLGGVRKELGIGYSSGIWVLCNFTLGFLFLVGGFASGLSWLSGLGVFALLLAFLLIFLAQWQAN